MERACIILESLPIDLADLSDDILDPIANRPWMPRLEHGMDRELADQMARLRRRYPDYYAPRHGMFRERYNCEAEKAQMGLWLKRRKVKRVES